jgi:hypothetical protein
LAVLAMLTDPVKVRGADPPKNAGGASASQRAGGAKPDAAKSASKPKAQPARPQPDSGPVLRGGEKAIRKAMKEKTSVAFVETPLKDVLDYLSQKHQIPIHIDAAALKEAGVDESTPVTCKLSGNPLRSVLEIMLDELQLKWVIHHHVLMITSPAKAESDEYMSTEWYDVSDLVGTPRECELQNPVSAIRDAQGGMLDCARPKAMEHAPPGSSAKDRVVTDTTPIKDLITNEIATKTWVDNGGTGTIDEYDRLLTISQTQEVHAEIKQFLARFRARRLAVPDLSVELHWLWLDAEHRARLQPSQAKLPAERVSLEVDPQRLQQIAAEVRSFHARIICSNGIATAVAAGDRRSVVTSAIPVVGGDGVGYQPIISVPNVGVVARVRPTFVPGTKTAMLDILSLITRWEESRPRAILGAAWPAGKPLGAGNASPPPENSSGKAPAAVPRPAAPSAKSPGGSASCPVDQPVMPTPDWQHTPRSLGQARDRRFHHLRPGGRFRRWRGPGKPAGSLPDCHDKRRAAGSKVTSNRSRRLSQLSRAASENGAGPLGPKGTDKSASYSSADPTRGRQSAPPRASWQSPSSRSR